MTDYQSQLAALPSDLAEEVATLPNLEAILHWAKPGRVIDSVQQDEYNYDILVEHDEPYWLSFGSS